MLPAPYPLKEFDLANRIAVLGRAEGWARDYIVATYKLWFEEGLEAGGSENLTRALARIGQDHDRIVARAMSDDIETAYRTATTEARQRGIFGAPSFVIDGELFWGDDRLDDALSWYRETLHHTS